MNEFQNLAINESYNPGYERKMVGLLIIFIGITICVKIINTYFLNGKGNQNYSW